jgi:DNA polymerase-1
VHTQYIQTGTGTGRLSSKDPNLQNIPQESEWSKLLRSAFIAQEGYSFVALDYSQLELRLLAAVSGDKKMTEAFLRGDDIHKKTAQAVLGIAEDEVTKEDRRLAKTLNFGLIYGMGISAFAKATGISRAQSQEFVKKYFNQFPTIKKWQESIRQDARQKGYVQTVTGRKRYFPEIQSPLPQVVAATERAAINFPLQGLGADVLKMAMIG